MDSQKSFEYFCSLKPDLSAGTVSLYATSLKTSFRNACAKKDETELCQCLDDLSWIDLNAENIITEMEVRFQNKNTLRSRISHFTEVCKCLGFMKSWKTFSDKHKKLWKDLQSLPKQTRTAKQEEMKIEYTDFKSAVKKSQKIANKILKEDPNAETTEFDIYLMVQEALFLSIYFKFPLRRDIGDCSIIRNQDERRGKDLTKINYVERGVKGNKWYLFLNSFKNVKKVEKKDRIFDLGKQIGKYLNWIANSKINNTDSLLLNQKRQRMTRDTFSKLFQDTNERYTGKRSRNNDWRSSVVSFHFKDDTSLDEREKLAKKMTHSTTTQMLHYEKK